MTEGDRIPDTLSPLDLNSIEWVDVKSSNIRRVAWVPNGVDGRGELIVDFHHGDYLYVYPGLSTQVFEGIICADSVGNYFATQVKPNYAFLKYDRDGKMVVE
jgi:hypothetical protein